MLRRRAKEIEVLALKTLKDVGIESPPVSARKIAKHLGVSVLPQRFGPDISGALLLEPNNPSIGYNSAEGKKRRRFTIAHELGHYLLHATSDHKIFIDRPTRLLRSDVSSTGESKQEIEANAFAAALLMPAPFVHSEIKRLRENDLKSSDEELTGELAKKFDVSVMAMSYRLINLGLVSM